MNETVWGWLAIATAVVAVPLWAPTRQRPAVEGKHAQHREFRFNVAGGYIVGVTMLVVVPLPYAPPLALLAALLVRRFLPKQLSSKAAAEDLSLARTLPDAVDLLASLLRTGMPDGAAIGRVAAAMPPPLNSKLARVARHRQLGSSAHTAWREFLVTAHLAPLGQVMVRHAETGAMVASALDRVAADARRDYFAAAQAAARAAAVRSVIPLAVCFLPSFFLLGVVPIVASLLSGLNFS